MKTIQVPRRFTLDAWGGTETVVLETSRRLMAGGHATSILCSQALAPEPHAEISGVPVHRTPYFYPYLGLSTDARQRLDQKGGNLFSFSLLRALLREPNLDLIHAHTGKRLGGIVRTAARMRGIPYVVSLHGGVHDVPAAEARTWTAPTTGTVEWGRALGMAVGSRHVLRDAAAILCVGAEEARLTAAQYPHVRVEHLPNGVEPARFASGDGAAFRRRVGIPASAELMTVVGRIDGQKNQLMAVEVLQALAVERPGLHLAIIGPVTSAEYRTQIGARVAACGLGDRVHVIEGLSPMGRDLTDAYHASDLFVLPSRHEPFGIVVLEAWAAGVPVVTSNRGGLAALVRDGVDGLLADPDDLHAWATKVRTLLDAPQTRATLADGGRRRVDTEFTWDRITARMLQIYREADGAFSRKAGAKRLRLA